MNGEISRREDQPLDLSVELEVDRWNGAEQPQGGGARALSARRAEPTMTEAARAARAARPRTRSGGTGSSTRWRARGRGPARRAARRPGPRWPTPRAGRSPRRRGRGVPGRADLERRVGAGDLRGRRPAREARLRGRGPAPVRRRPAADRLLPLRVETRSTRPCPDVPGAGAGLVAGRLDGGRPRARGAPELPPRRGDRSRAERGARGPGLGEHGRPRLPPPRLGPGGARAHRAPPRPGVGAARRDRGDLARARRGRGRGRGRSPALDPRGRLRLPAHARDGRPLRAGSLRARPVRMAVRSRRPRLRVLSSERTDLGRSRAYGACLARHQEAIRFLQARAQT